MTADDSNPYRAPQAGVADAEDASEPNASTRIGRFWGVVFAAPCIACAFTVILGQSQGLTRLEYLVSIRWLLDAVLVMAAGWAFQRFRLSETYPRLAAASVGFGGGVAAIGLVAAMPAAVGHFSTLAASLWSRFGLMVLIALIILAALAGLYFVLMGVVIRWRIRVHRRRASPE